MRIVTAFALGTALVLCGLGTSASPGADEQSRS